MRLIAISKMLLKRLAGRGTIRSYAQGGEDVLAFALLRKARGTYVDVGAYHPLLYSNTYLLYRKGWHGLVIDPNEEMRALYSIVRPRDLFVSSGVGLEDTKRTYHRFTDGAYNTFSEAMAAEHVARAGVELLSKEQVRVQPLHQILEEAGVREIDFLNVDVEGLDREVLESHDWSVRPRIIAVEDNAFSAERARESEVYQFLSERAYTLAALSTKTLFFIDSKRA